MLFIIRIPVDLFFKLTIKGRNHLDNVKSRENPAAVRWSKDEWESVWARKKRESERKVKLSRRTISEWWMNDSIIWKCRHTLGRKQETLLWWAVSLHFLFRSNPVMKNLNMILDFVLIATTRVPYFIFGNSSAAHFIGKTAHVMKQWLAEITRLGSFWHFIESVIACSLFDVDPSEMLWQQPGKQLLTKTAKHN